MQTEASSRIRATLATMGMSTTEEKQECLV
jgi:hypothetical protein